MHKKVRLYTIMNEQVASVVIGAILALMTSFCVELYKNWHKNKSYLKNSNNQNQASVPLQQSVVASAGWKSGDKVFHNKFGEGRVLQVEGSGNDARAHINFPRHGAKWLALGIAKLTALP